MNDPYAPSAPVERNDSDENSPFVLSAPELGQYNKYAADYVAASDTNNPSINSKAVILNAYNEPIPQVNVFDNNPYISANKNIVNFHQLKENKTMDEIIIADDSLEMDDEDKEGFGISKYGVRLSTKMRYRDPFWLFLWVAHLILMLVILSLAITHFIEWSPNSVKVQKANAGFTVIFLCAIVGLCVAYLWTRILRKYSGKIIKFMLFGNLAFLGASVIFNFLFGSILYAILSLVMIAIFSFYIWSVWKRIPFAEALIEIACTIMLMYHGMIVLAMTVLIFQILWILWWSAIMVAYLNNNTPNSGIVFLLLISFYWNLEVLKNIGHTTICGVAGIVLYVCMCVLLFVVCCLATWYFSAYSHKPTFASLKRAMTTSLGSIALGSFIVAFVQALRQIVRAIQGKSKNQIVFCVLQCLLTCLERVIQYFNVYAFAHVAIYGESYIVSAKNTWQLLRVQGLSALINDDLTGFAILSGALIGGLLCGTFGAVFARFVLDSGYMSTYAIFGFFIGFYLCLTVLHVVSSCVVALFVCYAEDPRSLECNHPPQFVKFQNARKKLTVNLPGDEDADGIPQIRI